MGFPCPQPGPTRSKLTVRLRATLAFGVLTAIPACDDPIPPDPVVVAGSMAMSPTSFDLIEGTTASFTVTVTDASGTPMLDAAVTWNSSDRNVIGVAGAGATATITGIGPGEATIWAASGNATASASGTVLAAGGFQAAIVPLFAANCAFGGCHGPPSNRAELNLTAEAAYGSLVNVPSAQLSTMDRVEPFDPANSYLMHKLQGSDVAVGGFRQQMPRGRDPLPQADIDRVIQWIKTGARRN